MSEIELSALVVAHNEEDRIGSCLDRLSFADEIVVVLDKCTDGTKDVAATYTDRFLEGSWDIEGERRNAGLAHCRGNWVLEIDSDEWVTEELAASVIAATKTSRHDWHEISVDNYIGERLVRYGWGGSFGTSAVPRLSRRGVKVWGSQRVHPSLTWHGEKGPRLAGYLIHHVDKNISDVIRRLDSYSTAKAADMRATGNIGSTANNVRRLFTRFYKCYVSRKGYKEGGYGLLIALCAGLFPLLSHLKAKLEDE